MAVSRRYRFPVRINLGSFSIVLSDNGLSWAMVTFDPMQVPSGYAVTEPVVVVRSIVGGP